MANRFVAKLYTENFQIGSFIFFEDRTKSLIKTNSNISDENVNKILQSMPFAFKASIVDNNGNYIGFIGIYDTNLSSDKASIRLETVKKLSDEEKEEILTEYKKWLYESHSIKYIEEELYICSEYSEANNNICEFTSNIIVPSKMLTPGISEETYQYFMRDYDIPSLYFPFSIVVSGRVVGIIGLSNLLWSNKRANLCLFLDKTLGENVINDLSPYLIDEFIQYAHSCNVHNVLCSVAGNDRIQLELLQNTAMNYFGFIPYGAENNEQLHSKMLFQHIPGMPKEKELIIPENISIPTFSIDTDKAVMDLIIELSRGYRLISPKVFTQEQINYDTIVEGHIKALQDRQGFAAPIGLDKYILEKGDSSFGISKEVLDFDYILVDDANNYVGYVNAYKKDGQNAEIEIGLSAMFRHKGLGTEVLNAFYNQLFSLGYVSVTSVVFDFNLPSLRMHDKAANLQGIRVESYYINGKLWNMHYYTKVNDALKR